MIKITADSTCDLSPEILANLDITLAPLYIQSGEQSWRDGVDITPTDIFELAENKKQTCSTAAVNVYDYQQLFAKYSPQSEAVIHLAISANLSACYQNASLAAADFSNVYVVDTRNLSTGSGYLVYDAALAAQAGLGAEAICEQLAAEIPLVDCSFVIDKLDYLHRGGRCSGLTALSAQLLNIKPCIEVKNGEMLVGKKYLGKFEKCLVQYVKDRLSVPQTIDAKRCFITHPVCSAETVEQVRATIAQYVDFDTVIETQAGCTVSNHCGPKTLGIIFKRRG